MALAAVTNGGRGRGGSGGSDLHYGRGEYEVTKWPTPSPLLIGK